MNEKALVQIEQALRENITRSTLINRDSVRLFHSRGYHYSEINSLSIDYFFPVVLFTFFEAPEERELMKLNQLLVSIFSEYADAQGVDIESLLVGTFVQARYEKGAPIRHLWGEEPDTFFAKRHDQVFKLSFHQQNIGFFLDMEPARNWLESVAKENTVLNLFSYTCAFSVVARAAGATSVVNIDMSQRALNVGKDNHKINQLSLENIKFLAHDIFKSWGKLTKLGPYDIVIIDPPSYQKGSFIASKDYQKVLKRMPRLVKPNGYVLACLNAPEIDDAQFEQQVVENLPDFTIEKKLAASPFFPEARQRGLKMLVFKRSANAMVEQ